MKMNLVQLQALAVQQKQVEDAMEAFVSGPDYEDLVESHSLTGNYLYLSEKNEYWFETNLNWHTDQPMALHRTGGWAHVFPELAEFDRMMGNPDPAPAWGFRIADSVDDALKGMI